jgi:hypothetical protein
MSVPLEVMIVEDRLESCGLGEFGVFLGFGPSPIEWLLFLPGLASESDALESVKVAARQRAD